MEEWAAAMGVPQEEGQPIMPERPARDLVDTPDMESIREQWNPLELGNSDVPSNDIVDENGNTIF